MRRQLLAILAFSLLISLMRPEKVFAACTPPSDYRDCPSSSFGTNGVSLMDSQYNPIETDFAKLRQSATQSDPSTASQRLQATIILTDGTIADQGKVAAIFNNAEKYGIDMTIRTWGNNPNVDTAREIGQNLSAEVAAYQAATGRTIRVELGNEPNLDTNGYDYAAAFVAFAQACTSCQIYLPSMGGVDLGAKQQFISEFMSNPAAASLADKATGIVFNSYADTPRGAVTDWANTLDLWQAAGVNTGNMSFFLTESGPPGGDINWPGLNDFLAGIAAEFEKIKNDPSDPYYKAFSQLEGLTFFVWTKDEKVIIVYVDKNGKVTTQTSLPSANVPGKIPLTRVPMTGSGISKLKSFPDEAEVDCPNEEGALNQQNETQPYIYRPAAGTGLGPTPEMRGNANLNFNVGVKGIHCGQSRSTPINLEEVAPYDLLQTPFCKEVGWAGEIQMNYAQPLDIDFRIPFAQEISDKLAGTWDPEHISECQMDSTRNVSLGKPPLVCTSGGTDVSNGAKFIVPKDVSKDPQYNYANRGLRKVTDTEPPVLVSYGYEDPPDPQAPQLSDILNTDLTQPGAIANTYRVQLPEGGDNPPWPVSAVGYRSYEGQVGYTPGGGHDIGGGYTQMVLYADDNGITLVNTRDDNPIEGYTTHYQNVKVNQDILAEYNAANANNRTDLPILKPHVPLFTSKGDEVIVAQTDTGEPMDPRSVLDWNQKHAGKPTITAKPFTNVGVTSKGSNPSSAQMAAAAKIDQKTGLLKKILAPDVQDKLKCDFINYVRRQGAGSMYANFKVDGTLLSDIPCSPRAPQMKNQSPMSYETWFVKWGKTWQRLALFPNERATGKLSFMVCDDQNYYINQAFPEVMKMGLAANTLFQYFTPLRNQNAFYGQSGYGNLRTPLSGQTLLGDGKTQTLSFASKKIQNAVNKTPVVIAAAESAINRIAQNITGAWKGVVGGVTEKLSSLVPEKLLAYRNLKLLAQANPDTELTFTPHVSIQNGKVEFSVEVHQPPFIEDDMAAEVYINGEKLFGGGYHKVLGKGKTITFGSTGSGADFPVWDPLPATPGKTYNISYKILSNYYCAGGGALCDNYTGTVDNVAGCAAVVGADGTLSTECGPIIGPPAPAPCNPDVEACQCRETLTCPYSDPTARAQLGPSDTEIWQYHKNHQVIGAEWVDSSGTYKPALVKLDWKIPAWHAGDRVGPGKPLAECDIVVPTRAADRTSCNGPQDDGGCGAPENACNETQGFCGTIVCTHTHERVVDVYNSVPFLASAWQQLAGISSYASGVFNSWKSFSNPSVQGAATTIATGCTDNPSVVFDENGHFVPNPGASSIGYTWNQGFGFAGAEGQDAFGDFGVSKVRVRLTQPTGLAKILFYRMGGLCNALKWLTSNNLLPMGIKNPSVLTASSLGVSLPTTGTVPSPGASPGTTPPATTTAATQPVPVPQVPTIVAQVSTVAPNLPKNETPKVSTVINASNLTTQTQFASVQNGDQILVYPQAQQVYIYRPTTKQIVATMPTINFAVRNGGAGAFGYEAFASKISQIIPNAIITDRNDAQNKTYKETFIVDVNGNNQAVTLNYALLLNIKVNTLPLTEPKPQTPYLIIVGSDQTGK